MKRLACSLSAAFLSLLAVLASLPGVAVAQSSGAGGQSAGTSFLLVLSKRDHTLAMVDPVSLKVLSRMPVGEDPHEVIASSDGRTAYVSNYGFGAYHTLAVLDLVARQARPSIDLGPLNGPHGLAFVGGKVWFTAEGAKALGRYDPRARKVDLVLGTGQNRTHMIYVSPDLEHIVTTNVASGTVSMIDKEPAAGMAGPAARVDWNEHVIQVGSGAEGFDLSPDGREIWVANAHDGTISVIDRASRRLLSTLHPEVSSANRLRFTPDGRRVLVSLLNGPDLVVLDAETREVVKRLPIGSGAAGIEMEPGGRRAFVACTPDNYVAIIDLRSLMVAGHIDAGGQPDGMAWATQQ